jgi:hypothetical protein
MTRQDTVDRKALPEVIKNGGVVQGAYYLFTPTPLRAKVMMPLFRRG